MLWFAPEPVRTRRRKSVAFTLSALAHAIPLVWGALTFSPDIDLDIDFEFAEVDMVDPSQLQGAKEEPEPEPEASYPPPGAELPPEGDDGGDPEEDPESEEKFGEKRSKVEGLGPTTATLYAFMANNRIRNLPYAEEGLEVVAPLPDFQFLIQGGGFDTLRDFDYLVIATPNPRDVSQTFLAVQHNMTESELQAGVERAVEAAGQTINWEERGSLSMGNPHPVDPETWDDPRWFVFLDDKVAVYVREEFLPSILEGPQGDRKTTGNFVANLTRMRRFAAREPRASFQFVAKDLRAQLAQASFPCAVPDGFELMAEAAADPELMIRVAFLTPQEAVSCKTFWNDKLGRIISETLWIKLMAGWIYDKIELTQDDRELTLRARFDKDQAKEILKLISSQSRKMLGRSQAEMETARKARDEAWVKRKGGKLPPSAAFAPDGDAGDEGPATPEGEDRPAEEGKTDGSPVVTQPTPSGPNESAADNVRPAKPDGPQPEPAGEPPI